MQIYLSIYSLNEWANKLTIICGHLNSYEYSCSMAQKNATVWCILFITDELIQIVNSKNPYERSIMQRLMSLLGKRKINK